MFIPALNDVRSTLERVAELLQDKKKTLPVQLAYVLLEVSKPSQMTPFHTTMIITFIKIIIFVKIELKQKSFWSVLNSQSRFSAKSLHFKLDF